MFVILGQDILPIEMLSKYALSFLI